MNGERASCLRPIRHTLWITTARTIRRATKTGAQSYGNTWDDSSQGAELYDGFISAAVAEAITEDAAWYFWHASRRQAMLEACWEKAGAFVHQQIIWVKDRGVLTRSHYLWKHEPCLMGWRRPNRPPKVAEQTLPSTWEMPSFTKDERPDHPTPKPLDAFGIPMRQHVARGGICYEPFAGSGSQIMAGEANGRRVFAMEISPAYVDVAVERWQAETGKDAILDGDGRTFAVVKGSDRLRRQGRCRRLMAVYYNDADPAACAWLRADRGRAACRMATWTSAPSSRCCPPTCAASRNAISSPGSAAGPYRAPPRRRGRGTGPSGPARRPASRSARPGSARDRTMTAISPPPSCGSSPPAGRSRLRRAGRQRGSARTVGRTRWNSG